MNLFHFHLNHMGTTLPAENTAPTSMTELIRLLTFISPSELIGPSKTKTVAAVRAIRIVVVAAVAHLQVIRAEEEVAAPYHPEGTVRRSSIVCRCARISSIPIPAPFPQISRHIIDTKRIRG